MLLTCPFIDQALALKTPSQRGALMLAGCSLELLPSPWSHEMQPIPALQHTPYHCL
jgi:hypothetical protein